VGLVAHGGLLLQSMVLDTCFDQSSPTNASEQGIRRRGQQGEMMNACRTTMRDFP
jgi:hypothetical protein